jgi:hypothetical protein
LAVNAKQWGTQTVGTQSPPPSKLQQPKAKLEALAVNAKQWGTQTKIAQANAPVPAADPPTPPPASSPAASTSSESSVQSYLEKLNEVSFLRPEVVLLPREPHARLLKNL